ncbi:NMO domain-containing protein [Fusarium keratoplasticum]|nr:NMO domain-containing protein [Fusarium keratoplasticum]
MLYPDRIQTSLTELLGIRHPVLLAGMNVAAGPKLAAAVTNAGGLGVIGGINYTPEMLRDQISELKSSLLDKKAPFGVDLLIPQIGGSARKTNKDYTKGKLNELVDIIIESGAKLFVSAVGVPPKAVVEQLHRAGILYMNMVGHPKHVQKCLDLDVDIICAQGGEGGGHTGDIPTTVLVPAVMNLVRDKQSSFTRQAVQVVAAGGIHDGRLLAATLMMGASAVWVGTRFILTNEAAAPASHKEAVRGAGFDDNIRTTIFTGRPMRVRKTPYVGVVPAEADLDRLMEDESSNEEEILDQVYPKMMGQCAAVIIEQKPAADVVQDLVDTAVIALMQNFEIVVKL